MKEYLGDGVYADDSDGFQIRLTVENGISDTDQIYLDKHVIEALLKYIERFKKDKK